MVTAKDGDRESSTAPKKPINSVYKKILQLRNEVTDVESSKMSAGRISYQYLSERTLTTTLRPVLQKLKLVIVPDRISFETIEQHAGTDKEGNPRSTYLTTVCKHYTIYDTETGDFIIVEAMGSGSDSMDKGCNKALTCAFKNLLKDIGMFPSPEREDPDNTYSGNTSAYTGNKSGGGSSVGNIMIKYGKYQGKTIKELFDENPEAVEEIANGNSKWLADKATEFLNTIKS